MAFPHEIGEPRLDDQYLYDEEMSDQQARELQEMRETDLVERMFEAMKVR